jgi:cytoskeleton protein RodZ
MIDIKSDNMKNTDTTKTNGLGARLKNAREAMSLTAKDAAGHLHLSVNIINIIENEQFADGPPPTFMRGYLRSYARLLNIPEHEIGKTLQELEITMPMHSTSLPIFQTRSKNSGDRYVYWITYLVVFTMVVLVALWWHSQQRSLNNDIQTKTISTTITPVEPEVKASVETPQSTNNTSVTTQPSTDTTATLPVNGTISNVESTPVPAESATESVTATIPTHSATITPNAMTSSTDTSLATPNTVDATPTPSTTSEAETPPPQVDTPPIISNATSGIGLTESQIPPISALPTTSSKPAQKHKRPIRRQGSLPGMPSVNMTLPEPG